MTDTIIELNNQNESSEEDAEDIDTEDIIINTNYEKLDKVYNYRNTLMTVSLFFFMFNCVSIVISMYNIINIVLIAIGILGIWNLNICLVGNLLIFCILRLIVEIILFTYNINSVDETLTIIYTFNILFSKYFLNLILRYIIQINYLTPGEKQIIKNDYNVRNRRCILC